jgi:hypothetical protein
MDGSIVETHGTVNACLSEGRHRIEFKFQLVNKQVDFAYDGIIGRDFLQDTRATICFKNNTVVFDTPEGEWTKMIGEISGNTKECRICTVKIPRRLETIVKMPVENGVLVEGVEGIIEKTEITEGVYLASSLIKVIDNQAITSILNTRETDAVIRTPELRWEE